LLLTFAFVLDQPGFIQYAVVDPLKSLPHHRGFGLAEHIAENLFLTLRLEDGFPDPCFYSADIAGEKQALAKEGGKLPVDRIDFSSPFFKFTPVIVIVCTAVGHDRSSVKGIGN
jgi:hypothetical protein